MKIGCLKERKNHEYRVGLTPANVTSYINHGHIVYIEKDAGLGAGFSNEDYINSGAIILDNMIEIYKQSDMVIKVKEPEEDEYPYFRPGLIIFTFLHLAANNKLTKALLDNKVTAIAYETITDENGHLPCLRPMSEIAGKLSVQEGAKYLEKSFGGRGVLLGGVTGVEKGTVVIIGGGVAGINATKVAIGMGANVIVIDNNMDRLIYLDDVFNNRITTLYSSEENIKESLKKADLVIGTVLIPGASAPKIIKKEYLKDMKKGAVIVDVAIDQGGCVETSRITSHDNPIFIKEDIIHYCVNNMPGAVPHTSTIALTNVTTKYGLLIADNPIKDIESLHPSIRNGINTFNGVIVNQKVKEALDIKS